MIIQADVLKCNECAHRWLQAGESLPKQCPSRKCRSSHWNASPMEVARTKLKPGSIIPCSDPKRVTHAEVKAVIASQARPAHSKATCHVYGCLMCKDTTP